MKCEEEGHSAAATSPPPEKFVVAHILSMAKLDVVIRHRVAEKYLERRTILCSLYEKDHSRLKASKSMRTLCLFELNAK